METIEMKVSNIAKALETDSLSLEACIRENGEIPFKMESYGMVVAEQYLGEIRRIWAKEQAAREQSKIADAEFTVCAGKTGKGSLYTEIVCMVSSAAIGISAFLPSGHLPWFGVEVPASMMNVGDGIVAVLLAVFAFICSCKRAFSGPLIVGVVSLGTFVLENAVLYAETADMAGLLLRQGTGDYLMLAASAALILFAATGMRGKGKGTSE